MLHRIVLYAEMTSARNRAKEQVIVKFLKILWPSVSSRASQFKEQAYLLSTLDSDGKSRMNHLQGRVCSDIRQSDGSKSLHLF